MSNYPKLLIVALAIAFLAVACSDPPGENFTPDGDRTSEGHRILDVYRDIPGLPGIICVAIDGDREAGLSCFPESWVETTPR